MSYKVEKWDGKIKGYGFVQFEIEEVVNVAIEKINGMLIEGRCKYMVFEILTLNGCGVYWGFLLARGCFLGFYILTCFIYK